jgi:hypothetical protein
MFDLSIDSMLLVDQESLHSRQIVGIQSVLIHENIRVIAAGAAIAMFLAMQM